MKTVVLDPLPPEVERLIERRKRLGLDGYDEMWEGVYHMAPMARGADGDLQAQLIELLGPRARAVELVVTGPFNLGDGAENFRVPDAGCHRRPFDPETLYYGTAAAVAEVVSPGDETYDKFPFYAAHKVDEVLVVEPVERRLVVFSLASGHYDETDRSDLLRISASELQAAIRWR